MGIIEIGTPPGRREPVAGTPAQLAQDFAQLFALAGEAAECECEARIAAMSEDFLRGVGVSSDIELKSLLEEFRESRIPASPSRAAQYLDYLAERVVAHSTRTSSPRFIGHMTSALPYFIRPLAKLMTTLNQNVVKLETAKALSFYERQSIAMMHRLLFGFDDQFYDRHIQSSESTLGMIVSGGTLANITALWCARNAAFGPRAGFAGIEAEGLPAALKHYGYEGAVVIGSSLMHFSFEKAAGLLGIGTRSLIKVPVNHVGRMDLAALRRVIAECRARKQYVLALVGVAGTTDCGAIDPLRELAAVARETGAHFHVDAAWGGPILFSRRHRHKLAGIEEADSVTIDGHKQLYLPMGIGMLMLRDPQLARGIEKQAHYVLRANSRDLGKRTLEGSRPGMALFLHAALHLIGAGGYEFLIDEGIRKAQHMAALIDARPEFELLLEPEMNILAYRYLPEEWRAKARSGRLTETDNQQLNRFNERLQKAQRRAGHSFVSRTTLEATRYGRAVPVVALRAVLANPLTAEADIEAVLSEQLLIAAELGEQPAGVEARLTGAR